MRVVVLGGTGLTGPFLVRQLHALGHQITVVHRGIHRAALPPGVCEIVDGSAPPAADVVIHMRAVTERGAREFLDRFAGNAGRAVVISSGDVYRAYGRLKGLEGGEPESELLTEEAPLRESRFPYRGMANACMENADEYDKVLVENALRSQSRLPVTILRYPAVYGPHDMHRFGSWLALMKQSDELRIDESFAAWRWTHGYAEDVAAAAALAATLDRAAGRTYHVGEGVTPTWQERLEEWGRTAGWRGKVVPVAAAEVPPEQRMPAFDYRHHLAFDTTRIRTDLGYGEVVPRAAGIARTIEWERSANPPPSG